MKTKHTPGPWKVDPANEAFVISGDGSCNIASVWEAFHLDGDQKVDEAIANGRLIAAAPELLSALENLVFLHGCEQEGIACGQPTPKQWIDAVDAAQKAIDKAKVE